MRTKRIYGPGKKGLSPGSSYKRLRRQITNFVWLNVLNTAGQAGKVGYIAIQKANLLHDPKPFQPFKQCIGRRGSAHNSKY
jgi:hypothetical protein